MSFSGTLENLNRRIREVIEENEDLELSVTEVDGVEIRTIDESRGRFGFVRQLSWAQFESQLLIGSGTSAITKHVEDKRLNKPFVDSKHGKRLFDFGEKNELEGPLVIMSLDWKEVLEMIQPFVGGLSDDFSVIPELDIRFGDVPKIDVLKNGLTPSLNGLYRTGKGYQMYHHQIQPGGAPVATLGFLGLLNFVVDADK